LALLVRVASELTSRTMRAAVIYMHASKGASRAIAVGIDRQLAVAAKRPKGRGRGGASGT
jgi:hypothetical protein